MMHPTFHPLPEEKRQALVIILNQLIADALSLAYAAKQAHWNIKGPDFIARHKLLDEVYNLFSELVDQFAETVISLGGQAYGTVEYAAKETLMPPFPLDINNEQVVLLEVTKRVAAFSSELIECIAKVQPYDLTTQNDLMTAHSNINKYLYFLESHLLEYRQ